MELTDQQSKLTELAQQDEVYLLWQSCYTQYAEEFEAYTDGLPEDVRNMLRGYAESGRLMYQRMVNLACENMIFPKK